MRVTDQAFQVLRALLTEPEQEILNRARPLTDADTPAFEALLEIAGTVRLAGGSRCPRRQSLCQFLGICG
jgi:hypothetical protein